MRSAVLVLQVGQRLDERHDAEVGQLGREARDHLQGARQPRVGVFDAQQGLAPVEAHARNVLGVVGGEAVVELPLGADDAAAVHRADCQPALEHTEVGELLENVGARHDPIDTIDGQATHEPVEEREPVGDRERIGAHAEHSARGVIGCKEHEPTVDTRNAPWDATREGSLERLRLANPSLDELGIRGGLELCHATDPFRWSRTNEVRDGRSGMASAHMSREATNAPAPFANSPIRSSGQPWSRP